jgi:hypothetical protein
MSWSKETDRTPTAIGGLEVMIGTRPRMTLSEEVRVFALDQWEGLGNIPEVGHVQAVRVADGLALTEGVDFEIDYSGCLLRALTGGVLLADDVVGVTYEYVAKAVRYSLVVLDQDGRSLKHHRDLNLLPHLTAGEKTQLQAFMETLRARAEAQLL